MPTKRERSAPMSSVSVPTRTICRTTRWRSAGTKAAARTVAKKRRVASPRTWRPSRRLAPRRVSAPGGRGAWPSASTAMGKLQVPGAAEPAVLARGEPPEETPVARSVGARVPAHETVERRPQGEEPAVLREQAVEERRRLAEGAPVVLLAAQPREHRRDHLVLARDLVHERLTPLEELEHAPALVVVVVHVLGLSPVGGPGVEARRDAPHVAPTVEGEDPPDLPVALAEPPLAEHERPGRADALGPLALVDGVRVGEEAVAAHAAPGAVDGGEERQIEAPALPAVAGHQALAADVEGPEHVARPLLADDLPRTVEGQHVEPAAAGPAVGGEEREARVPPLDLRLGELEVSGEHHHPHAPVAGEVVEVQVEGCHRELAAALRAGAVEDEREEREAARPLGRRRRLLRRGRGPGAGTVGEEEQTEGLVVLLPARRGERVEDVGAVIVPGAAPHWQEDYQTFRLLLFTYRTGTRAAPAPKETPPAPEWTSRFTLFPFVFYRSSPERGRQLSVAPFYLDLDDFAGYRRVRMVMFPAYLELSEPQVERRYSGFPFFAAYC